MLQLQKQDQKKTKIVHFKYATTFTSLFFGV